MPINVRRFVWLWLASIVISLVDFSLFPPPSSSELHLGMTRSIQIEILAGGAALWVAVRLPFFWLTVWRRKNWARLLLLVVFVAGSVFSFVFYFVHPNPPPGIDPSWLHMPPSMIVVGWLGQLTEAAAFYFLFTGDAGPWFGGRISN
jgi:hypothetical protein